MNSANVGVFNPQITTETFADVSTLFFYHELADLKLSDERPKFAEILCMATPLSVVMTSLTRLLFVNSVSHLGNHFQFGDEKRADSK